MYLGCTLLEAGRALLPVVERQREGGQPNLCVLEDGRRIWIEATIPDEGAPGPNQIVRPLPIDEGGGLVAAPIRQAQLRTSGAFRSKTQQVGHYIEQGVIAPQDIRIIAISASRFGVYTPKQPLPLIMTTLFPIGDAYVTIDRETGDVLAEGFHAALFCPSPPPSCPAYCFSRRALRRCFRRDLVTDQHRQLFAPGPADQLCPQSLDADPAAQELGLPGSRVRDDPTRQRMAGQRHPGPGYNGGVMPMRCRLRICRLPAREVYHGRA